MSTSEMAPAHAGSPNGSGPTERASYYGRPVVKEPVWIWSVPVYFFAGGAAGAAAVLAAAARAVGGRELQGLVKRGRSIAAVGGAAGAALLIADLGRPERFLNMLRVFRASSPLSVGSWVLAGASGTTAGSALLTGRGRFGSALADLAGAVGGALGMPLSGYTGVVLTNTAIPSWQAARRSLPALFVASSASSGGALLELVGGLSDREARIVKRFRVAGSLGEMAAMEAVEREVASAGDAVVRPYREGRSADLWRASKMLTAGSLGLSLLPRRWRWARTLAPTLAALGSLTMRFGVVETGQASARDPEATFAAQRSGHGAAQVTGAAGVTGSGGRRATD